MSDYFTQLRNKRELIKMREAALENWRAEILSEEEHPFVDVMPEGTDEATSKKSKKKDKEEKKEEKVEEGYKSINPEYQYVGHSRAKDAAKKAVEKGDTEGMKRHLGRAEAIKSPTRRQLDLSKSKAAKLRKEDVEISEGAARDRNEVRAKLAAHDAAMKSGGESPYFKKKKTLKRVQPNGDPWSATPSDAKAHAKEDKK